MPVAVEVEALGLNGRPPTKPGIDYFSHLQQAGAPKEMDALVEALHGRSKLLALPLGSTMEQIAAAYGQDLELLRRYRAGFRQTIEAAIRARANEDQIDAQTHLAELAKTVGDIGHDPKLDLDETALKLEPDVLRARMQAEFREDVEDLKAGLTIWLQELVASDILSAVEWLGPTAVKYHFFRMESERGAVKRSVNDPGMRLDGRYVTTTESTRVRVFAEQRTHTLVGAARHAIEQYRDRVPARIARLIDTISSEVRPFVQIVDGQVTKEEVSRRTVDDRIETTSFRTWVNDPAPVLFGTYALAGWGGSTPEEARSLYRGHATTKANSTLVWSGGAVIAAALLAMPLGGLRIAAMVGIVGLALVVFHQLGLRVDANRNATTTTRT